VGDIRTGAGFRPLWLRLPRPGCQLQEGNFWLKFYWKQAIIWVFWPLV